VSWWLERLSGGDRLLSNELTSPLRCLVLSVGLLRMGSCSLPLPEGMPWLRRGPGVRPRCRGLQWSYRHGLSGWCIFQPTCGCGRSRRCPCAEPSGDGEAGVPLSTGSCLELIEGVLDRGLQPRRPTVGRSHKDGT
jgi:hypothetical protein